MHGSGLYQFDLTLAGWFGHPQQAADTASLWEVVRSSRNIAEQLYATESTEVAGLQPEIAVFVDDESMGHLLLGGPIGESLSAQNGPARWLDPLQSYLAELGAPVHHFHLRDLQL